MSDQVKPKIVRTEAEWKQILTPEQFEITRRRGTERAFTGKYWDHHEEGLYACICCGSSLFSSESKFDSGTGWPSFSQPISSENVEEHVDTSAFMKRTEVTCEKCGSHLGHLFADGPRPSGLRYCLNSASLTFTKNG